VYFNWAKNGRGFGFWQGWVSKVIFWLFIHACASVKPTPTKKSLEEKKSPNALLVIMFIWQMLGNTRKKVLTRRKIQRPYNGATPSLQWLPENCEKTKTLLSTLLKFLPLSQKICSKSKIISWYVCFAS